VLTQRRIRMGVSIAAVLAMVGCGVTPAVEAVVPPAAGATAIPSAEAAAPPATIPSGPAALAVSVADGSEDVPVDSLITVTPRRATVTEVEVTTTASGQNAAKVTGSVNADGVWTADTRLDPGASYTVTARGKADDGAEVTARSRFSTVSLSRSQEVFPTLTPILGGPFGVAQPIVVQFDLPVTDKTAFEQNLHVTSTPAQEGSWGWISDTEVHYRPKDYWQSGTTVHLDARLNGVNAGNSTYGQLNRTLDLTIGKRQTGTVDLDTKQLTFTREGEEPQVFPISAGKEGFTTRSGVKVIMEKLDSTRMDSETTGIDNGSAEGYDMQVAWALRLTSSGEFFHAAPWNEGNFGTANVSHGCTGLSTADAYTLFEQAQIGDPFEFTGSERSMEFGNGWSGWNETWEQWQERSAV
jgi:lipoprotein-anchoring transpeptidase ErfK/SrfK